MSELTVLEKVTHLRKSYEFAMEMLALNMFTRSEAIDYQTIALNQFLGVR
jgi:hypothetical protein